MSTVAVLACGDDGGAADAGSSSSGAATTSIAGEETTADEPGTSEATTSGASVDSSSSGSDDASTTGASADENTDACEGVTLRPKPNDTGALGPWPVGARTVTIDDLTVEVFYPAAKEPSGDPVRYDVRDALPPDEAAKISDEANPWQPCNCGRDLAIDDAFGPYPVLMFVHGTAGWRTQSLRHLTHWASRGFVVLSADHPGLMLRDILAPLCGGEAPPRDLAGDLEAMLAAVRGETAELSDFSTVMDTARVGMTGHSAGGGAVGPFADDAQVIIPLAAGPAVSGGSALQSTLILGGTADSVVPYATMQQGYEGSASPKRLVGIANAGHLVPSEICTLENEAGQDLLEVAAEAKVCGAGAAGFLFQCGDRLLDDEVGWAITEYATAAAFEEVLHCSPAATEALDAIQVAHPDVVEFLSE
ncbi:MAG: hypothetical protein AAGA54_37490 [Myxococcota bacterium]